jgi:hypothetical protein
LSFKFRERDWNSFLRKTCDASFVILLVAGENIQRLEATGTPAII